MPVKFSLKHIEKILPIIGISLFIYIVIDIGLFDIINTFFVIPWYLYIIAIALFFPKLMIAAYKWKLICKAQNINVSFRYLSFLYLVSIFYGSVTPAGLGFHIRLYFLAKKAKIRIEKSIANSFIDGIITLIAGTSLAVVGSILIVKQFPSILPILLLILIFYSVAFVFFMERRTGSKFINIIIKPFIPQKFKMDFDDSIDKIYEDLPRFKDTYVLFILECIVWIIAATQVYILTLSFSLGIPYHVFILLSITTVIIATMIPITIGCICVREGVFVLLHAPLGVSYEVAFVLSLAGYLVKNLIPGIIGMVYSVILNLPVKTKFEDE